MPFSAPPGPCNQWAVSTVVVKPAYLAAGLSPRWDMRATCRNFPRREGVLVIPEKRPNIAGSRPVARVADRERRAAQS